MEALNHVYSLFPVVSNAFWRSRVGPGALAWDLRPELAESGVESVRDVHLANRILSHACLMTFERWHALETIHNHQNRPERKMDSKSSQSVTKTVVENLSELYCASPQAYPSDVGCSNASNDSKR